MVCRNCRPRREFGLYDDYNASVLKALNTDVQITNSIARVTLTQIYVNRVNGPINTEYTFPINDLGVFDSFTATFENRVVKGVIKEKEKAKEEYEEGVKQGHMMGYAEIKEKTPDIMQVKLGNLPAKSQVTIKLSYLQKLEIS
jgi:hypothetical protein